MLEKRIISPLLFQKKKRRNASVHICAYMSNSFNFRITDVLHNGGNNYPLPA